MPGPAPIEPDLLPFLAQVAPVASASLETYRAELEEIAEEREREREQAQE